MRRLASLALVVLAAAGCQGPDTADTGRREVLSPKRSSPAQDEQALGRLASLAGEWEMQDENGAWIPASVFAVSSNGSVVREIMFPATPHEMTNLYHMDGSRVVATHYCAVGNQPRMVAEGVERTREGPALDFTLESVSNLRESHDHVMGGLRLTFVDPDTLHQHWTTLNPSGDVDHEMTFVMRRKR